MCAPPVTVRLLVLLLLLMLLKIWELHPRVRQQLRGSCQRRAELAHLRVRHMGDVQPT